jgi:hypothetical protein
VLVALYNQLPQCWNTRLQLRWEIATFYGFGHVESIEQESFRGATRGRWALKLCRALQPVCHSDSVYPRHGEQPDQQQKLATLQIAGEEGPWLQRTTMSSLL